MPPRLDPELGDVASAKRDDDLYVKGGRSRSASSGWRAKTGARVPPRKTLKRLCIILLFALAVYIFVHNIPVLGPQDFRRPVYPHSKPNTPQDSFPKLETPARGDAPDRDLGHLSAAAAAAAAPPRDNDGPVRFLQLAETLHAISGTKGSLQINQNVLYMASSLKSAGILLPMACQMGKERRSYVHFALVSRSEISLAQLRDLNGIDDSCQITFHDARPEHSSTSTDERFEKAVGRALFHINNYMHPQAVFVDASDVEEQLFLRAVRAASTKFSLPAAIIELPAHADDRLAWVTKLEAASLLQWNRVSVDILVHAHEGASGSLIRLLKSLSAADLTAHATPHLTIELPEKIDPPTEEFLKTFRWPPRRAYNPTNANLLTLRHRISMHGMSEEESSARFLEGFWPANKLFSHVLVLSPQVELSPNFFHYLKMTLLEYRYSSHALTQSWDQRLFGISLDLPSTQLSGTGSFKPPTKGLTTPDDPDSSSSDAPTSFLWQAPNSNAALFTGEKWTELHAFVARVLDVQRGSRTLPALLAGKSVSKKYPAWMEHALRLCRARGYWTLYPGADLAKNLASIHNELYHQPEEYEREEGGGGSGEVPDGDEVVLRQSSLLDSLPGNGQLQRFEKMPLISWEGTGTTTLDALDQAAFAYTTKFRSEIGGCTEPPSLSSRDLFCTVDDGT